MSMRLLTFRLIKHGRCFLRSYWSRDIHINILEQSHFKTRSRRIPTSTSVASNVAKSSPAQATKNAAHPPPIKTAAPRTNSNLFRVGQHARRLFIDNILGRVTTNYSEELRQQATKKLFYGDSAPFFALIGVSLASGAGVLSKEDELEGVCWEIREAASRLQSLWNKDDVQQSLNSDFNISQLEVGPAIAKGCAAVVYAAAFKNQGGGGAGDGVGPTENITKVSQLREINRLQPEYMTPLQNMSRFVHNFGGSVDNLNMYNESLAATALAEGLNKTPQQDMSSSRNELNANNRNNSTQQTPLSLAADKTASINRYPLALKMMFNYDIQSNALSILRAMYKETVPARRRHKNTSTEEWERILQHQTVALPAHPNIVCMFGFFCDEVGNFPDGHLLYPIAQPQRINPMGYGRNMSLYLLMKRYNLSLRGLLDTHDLSMRNKLLLFAQLLEAVAHISRHGIAHRDLKSDNILIELNEDANRVGDVEPPVLVLSDFGCCLADKAHGLQVPYNSYDVDKGGNTALMAPEIINKQPGAFTVLNYAKADLWACGAIAYEIFGLANPFYSSSGGLARENGQLTYSLRNSAYKHEDLPSLSNACPPLVQQLIYNILSPNPSKRISPDIAANVLQLFLWAPSRWLKAGSMPNSADILQWLLSLTTKVICEGRPQFGSGATTVRPQFSYHKQDRRPYVEYLLICNFLARARIRRIRSSLNWIQDIVAA